MTESASGTPRLISPLRASELFAQPPQTVVEWAVYEYACTFVSPILFDRMTDAQIRGLVTGEKVDYPKDEPLRVKALRKLYSDKFENDMPSGAIGIPNVNFYACLRDTGKKVKYGSGTWDFITGGQGTKLYAMIRLVEPFVVLRDMDGKPLTQDEVVEDCRKGNATQGSGAVGIIRGRVDEAGFCGHMMVAVSGEYVLPERKLGELIDKAGLAAGLCSARPGKGMPFGQFIRRHLKWVDGAKPRQITVSATEMVKPKRGRKKTEEEPLSGESQSVNGHEEVDQNEGNGKA